MPSVSFYRFTGFFRNIATSVSERYLIFFFFRTGIKILHPDRYNINNSLRPDLVAFCVSSESSRLHGFNVIIHMIDGWCEGALVSLCARRVRRTHCPDIIPYNATPIALSSGWRPHTLWMVCLPFLAIYSRGR